MREMVEKAAKHAGHMLMEYYAKPDLKIFSKPDDSPVTEADLAVSDFLKETLEPLGYPVVTEESVPAVQPQGEYFIIDPLDGTRYFIDKAQNFAVLIAFISWGRPVMGISYFPALNLFFAAERGQGALLNGERIHNDQTRQDLVAFSSGFHLKPQGQELLKALNITEVKKQGSLLKMGYMARGEVDFYPRFGRTYEWDSAAGQILLEEAGCCLWNMHTLQPMEYGKPGYLNPAFLCFRKDLAEKVREVFKDATWNRK